jgi:DNA-binding NarL/FixJ family response regulator
VIRIVLVDDHKIVRAGLVSLLEAHEDLTVVGTAQDGSEALDVVAATLPDVVLMDLSMPKTDGVSATRSIVAAHPDVQVVVLTSFADAERVHDALDAGAVGYLLKDTDPDDLVAGIRSVVTGGAPLDPRVARTVLTHRPRTQTTELTGRETEVLRLVGQGLANKQIARVLGISERTVKAHLTNAFGRIGVADRTSAALWVQRNLAEG